MATTCSTASMAMNSIPPGPRDGCTVSSRANWWSRLPLARCCCGSSEN